MEWIHLRLAEILNEFKTAKENLSQVHAETDWQEIEKMEIRMQKILEHLERLQRLANIFQILKKDEITEEIRKHIEEIKALIDKCDDAYKTALRNQGYLHE